ncbi:MAG: acyl-CoA cholesterol acyltransferase [Planctomycetaceae bacterium]|nr:acyl-CoA cholesterol acyltransferase [Planctomycetaceae bacterium]
MIVLHSEMRDSLHRSFVTATGQPPSWSSISCPVTGSHNSGKLRRMMGSCLVRYICSISTTYLVAVTVWPLLKCRGPRNLVGTALAIVGIALCPALIPAENIVARAICCLVCIDPLFRVLDYSRQWRMGTVTPDSWWAYWTFLLPFPFLLAVFGEKQRAQRTILFDWKYIAQIMAGLSVCAMALFLCVRSHDVAILRESFLLDHLFELLLFIVVVESLSQVQFALERLCGFDAIPLTNHAYLARTPAEFWFRYNQQVRQWLYVNVFVPCGGRRNRPTGIIAVFLVSAIFHEFFFALATSRLDGYQFAFFMLQAPAVILSPRLERLAGQGLGGRFAAQGLTLLWFAVTSPLFFHGLNRVFPFISASQSWLP